MSRALAATASPRARSRGTRALGVFALLLAGLMPAWAAAQVEPEGFPDPGAALVDPDFRVQTREFGLDRRVEMYQWRLGERGYEQVWHAALIDAAGFGDAHRNPPQLPIENQRWWSERPTLDGKPLDPSVLRTLGEWKVLRPGFSRLPANLAASFQPEGEGLGSAENPLEPQVGDLRVTWRELVLPPLAGKLVLRDGTWRLAAETQPDPPAAGAEAAAEPQYAQRMWPFFAAALVVIAAVVVALRRRRHRHHA